MQRSQGFRISSSLAVLLAWLIIGTVNVVAIAMLAPRIGLVHRLVHHAYDAAHNLALGLACALAITMWERFVPAKRAAGLAAMSICSIVLATFIAAEDLDGIAQRLATAVPSELVLAALVMAVSLAVPAAALVAVFASKRGWRWLGGIAGVALAIANQRVYPHDTPGLHVFLVLCAVASLWGALVDAPLPRFARRGWWSHLHDASRARRVIVGALSIVSLFAVLVPPPNEVLRALLSIDGSVLPPFLSRAWRKMAMRDRVLVDDPWFVDRSAFPSIPPHSKRLLSDDAVVVVVSIDCLRAEVLASSERRDQLPTLFALRDRSIWFSQARSPGAGTVYTLASMFMGTYFSQQYWTRKTHGKQTWVWPHEDDSIRFTQLLQDHGVTTVHFSGMWWFLNEWGVTRGFSEETLVSHAKGWQTLPAKKLADRVIDRLKDHEQGALFLFVHFLDPHMPYNLGGKKADRYESYVAEVVAVDRQLRRIVKLLEDRFPQRGALIVMGDHGESFMEHGLTGHATTLYEENIRVPLLIHIPGVEPDEVTEPVSLIDLGPTILDAFGLATPSHFMGQSLVPLIHGEASFLTRPIVAETRLKQSMVFRDGYKAIRDVRTGVLEVYDLFNDPAEQTNLLADNDVDAERHMQVLESFFEVQTNGHPDYVIPFRK